jgi:transposase-like protein
VSDSLATTQAADAARRSRYADHQFHVWINQRQEQRRVAGELHESDLYEWKNMLQELPRLPQWLKAARTGTLRTVHQQCSRVAPEPIAENRLLCALGVDVTTCPILHSLYESFATAHPHYGLTPDDADGIAAKVCTWHLFTEKQQHPALDTSEGYVQDESDRSYWATLYAQMSAADDVEGDE